MERTKPDYYEQIAKQEEKSAKLAKDYPTSPEDRRKYNIERTLKLREGE